MDPRRVATRLGTLQHCNALQRTWICTTHVEKVRHQFKKFKTILSNNVISIKHVEKAQCQFKNSSFFLYMSAKKKSEKWNDQASLNTIEH
jgi:hypothetical protein